MLNLRIGILLGLRQLKRANIWTSLLIITVVVFTVTNLVVISGILTGITDGVLRDSREQALGDIIIDPLPGESLIKNTPRLLEELSKYNQIDSYSPRHEGLVTIEANYTDHRDSALERDMIGVNILGIDPEKEDETLRLSKLVTEGEYFDKNDSGYILIGKHHIDRYAEEYGNVFDSLENIHPGSVVKLTAGTETKEFTVKGIVHSKLDMVALQVYVPEQDFRRMFKRKDYDASQIIIRLTSEEAGQSTLSLLRNTTFTNIADVTLFRANIPKYVKDVIGTFNFLSMTIGGISILVASITIFIIIFINALSRRRQIGILKGIGIDKRALQYAYAFQAAIYGITGTILSLFVIFSFLIPYFGTNPIDFPYTDVSISINAFHLTAQCGILLLTMIFAGLLPAWLIVRQNTLDAILGKK